MHDLPVLHIVCNGFWALLPAVSTLAYVQLERCFLCTYMRYIGCLVEWCPVAPCWVCERISNVNSICKKCGQQFCVPAGGCQDTG